MFRALLAAVLALGGSLAHEALGQTDQPQESLQLQPQSTQSAEGDAERKAAEARAAIEACNRGATPPAWPGATEKPTFSIQFYIFNISKDEEAQRRSACAAAVAAEPDNARLRYQLARLTYLGGGVTASLVTPTIRQFADAGVADAQYLMSGALRPGAGEKADPDARRQASAYLRAAANAGHLEAISELINDLRAPTARAREVAVIDYDPREAVAVARRWGKPTPDQKAKDDDEIGIRDSIAFLGDDTVLRYDGFSDAERSEAFARLQPRVDAGEMAAMALEIECLRSGRGVEKNPQRARARLESYAGIGPIWKVRLAEALVAGEGGPKDMKRAYELIKNDDTRNFTPRNALLAAIYQSDTLLGRRPRQAMAVLDVDSMYAESQPVELAELMLRTGLKPKNEKILLAKLEERAENGERPAIIALGRLIATGDSTWLNSDKAVEALRTLSDKGDIEGKFLYAAAQIYNLDKTSYQPMRRTNGLPNDAIKALTEEAISRQLPAAYTFAGKLLRRGAIYAQDDRLATASFIKAAELGDVEAMLLAGKALDDGQGVEKNPRERLRWWREAAKRGSVPAMESLASAFIFDHFNKMMTLQEGVTLPVSLYLAGVGSRYGDSGFFGGDAMLSAKLGSLFSGGGRGSEAGAKAVALAVMDAFRMSPGGLSDDKIVPLGRIMPQPVKLEIERELKRAGALAGEPDGYFGPPARQALATWVESKGVLTEQDLFTSVARPAPTAVQGPPTAPGSVADAASQALPKQLVDQARDKAFTTAQRVMSKQGRDRQDAVRMLNTMARYGDHPARWALVRNYHTARDVRQVVSPEEVTRYGLDILLSKPAGVEKADFEYIFSITKIYQERKVAAFARAFIDAVRDDPRLQDPLALGGVAQHLQFAPGACDALAAEAKRLKISGMGGEGCDERSREAIIAFAKASGAAGADAKARQASIADVRRLAEETPTRR